MQVGWFGLRRLRTYPNVFVVEPTNRCNLTCNICPAHGFPDIKTREQGDMPLERYCEIIETISKYLTRKGFTRGFVVAHGAGEPLLYRDYIAILLHIRKQGNLKFGFLTNGIRMMESMAAQILETGVDEVGFSINGIDRKDYCRNTGVDAWDQCIENLKTFWRLANGRFPDVPFIRVQTMVFEHSDENMASFIRWALNYSDEVVVQTVRSRTGRQIVPDLHQDSGRRSPCHRVVSPLTIGWNRDVYLCCEDWHGEKVLGNLDEISMGRILTRRREYIKLHRRGRYNDIKLCRDCQNWREPAVKTTIRNGLEELRSPLWCRYRKV